LLDDAQVFAQPTGLAKNPVSRRSVVAGTFPEFKPTKCEVNINTLLASQKIPLFEEGCNITGNRAEIEVLAANEHMCETWMNRKIGHQAAVWCEGADIVQCAECLQQVFCLRDVGLWRLVEESKPVTVARTPPRELKDERSQIRAQNFRKGVRWKLLMFGFRPESVANTRMLTASSSATLVGGRSRDRRRDESRHPAARVETRTPGKAGVDHHTHTVDR
jgi:hypothetical protein